MLTYYMGTLFCVSTPIGNLDDITIRAKHTLLQAPVIVCEDTKRTSLLIHTYEERDHVEPIHHTYIRYDRFTEGKRNPEILDMLEHGEDVVLCSDAGTPLVSDPGFALVALCRKKHIPIIVVPGASALLTALVASGLPTTPLLFYGFPPEKTANRTRLLTSLRQMIIANPEFHPTVVFYISPYELEKFLTLCASILGNIDITIARELTKAHEEVLTGPVLDMLPQFSHPKGEFVLLFSLK